MSPVEEPDFYESFDILWDAEKFHHAIRLYEFLGRPFWLAGKVGLYYEHTRRPDLAMHEYENMIHAYEKMGPDFLPIPGGPVELYKLGKWFMKTDPIKAERYLRLYVLADEKNPGEVRKTIFSDEATALLEELMNNKKAWIQQRLDEISKYPDVVSIRGVRVMPDALSLALRPPSRIGLWWYRLESGEIFYSSSAPSHLRLPEFPGLEDVRGCVRGSIFEKDGLNHVLIYKCDFPSEIMEGRVLVDIFQKVQDRLKLDILGGVVDEEGCDLLGAENKLT